MPPSIKSSPVPDPSHPSNFVTPGFDATGRTSYFESPPLFASPVAETPVNSRSYFSPQMVDDSVATSPPLHNASASNARVDSGTGTSSTDEDHGDLDVDPRVAYPTLHLSGRIISATFCIPHSLGFRSGQDWVSSFDRLDGFF